MRVINHSALKSKAYMSYPRKQLKSKLGSCIHSLRTWGETEEKRRNKTGQSKRLSKPCYDQSIN